MNHQVWVNLYRFKQVFVAQGFVGGVTVSGEGNTRTEAMLALGSAIKNLHFLF